MTLSCIVAVSENGVIGRKNGLPWKLSADLRRFKQLTTGHAIIMGRKTHDSIGRPLPGRRSVVITRNPQYRPGDPDVVHSLDDALGTCKRDEEVFVIGGQSIFEAALPRCQRLYLTRVDVVVDGDAFFPEEILEDFDLRHEEAHEADAKNPHDYTFQVLERRRTPGP